MTTVQSPAPSQESPIDRARRKGTPILLDRVSKWYGTVIGVNEVSVAVESGIVGLLGPNGAGKSTLMKLITGQIRTNIGRIRVFGKSVRNPRIMRRVGYCPDVDAFYEEMTGRKFVYTMLRLVGYSENQAHGRTEQALELVGMTDRGDRVLRGCSKGMRQRIKLAQALAHDPELLILDEPLSGLDPVGRREFRELFRSLANQGKTILISSHVMHEVEAMADSVILIGAGRVLAQGTWPVVAQFLNELPQRVVITCDRVRELVGELVSWPGVVKVDFPTAEECLVTTSDAAGLCGRVGELVRHSGYRVTRLRSESGWAETLFDIAQEA